MNNSYEMGDFRTRTINNILNRLGYTLKKVQKIKPRKKIAETDAIFENVHKQHDRAKSDSRILHISLDVKAKVKIGKLSRQGYSRTKQVTVAEDHDHKTIATLVPLGIHELNTEDTYLHFGNSKETPDFIADGLERWYSQRPFDKQEYDLLMIDLDNGQSVAGNTKRFLERMVAFSKKIGIPIQLVYYPPYHSKYNTIERFWAAVEQYWKPLILDTIDNTIAIAKNVTWKGFNPIVSFSDRVYKTGVKVASEVFKELEKFIIRNPDLKKWDVLINPFVNG
jgi:Rhodopirellula transposase.